MWCLSSNHTHFKKKNTLILSSNYKAFEPKLQEFYHPTICISTKNVWIFINPIIYISTKNAWISSSNHMHYVNQKCMNFIIQSYAAFQPKNVGISSSSNHMYFNQKHRNFIFHPCKFRAKTTLQECHHELFHHEFTKCMYVYFTMDVLWRSID